MLYAGRAIFSTASTVYDAVGSFGAAAPLLRMTELARGFSCLKSSSDAHRHDDVTVLVVVAFGRPQLPGRLGILQLEPHFAGAGSLQEINQVGRIEPDRQRLSVVRRLPSESSDSPASVDDAEILTSPFSSRRRTARERSSAN